MMAYSIIFFGKFIILRFNLSLLSTKFKVFNDHDVHRLKRIN